MATKKIDLKEWQQIAQFPKRDYTLIDVKKNIKNLTACLLRSC